MRLVRKVFCDGWQTHTRGQHCCRRRADDELTIVDDVDDDELEQSVSHSRVVDWERIRFGQMQTTD